MDHATTNGNPLVVKGALDLRRTAEVREALYALLSTTTGDVHVDLGDVDSIDMTILKMFVVANRHAERDGRRVVLRRCSPAVRRLLHLSHLRWMIPVEPDEGATDA
jgi:anti-anti-sigma factor